MLLLGMNLLLLWFLKFGRNGEEEQESVQNKLVKKLNVLQPGIGQNKSVAFGEQGTSMTAWSYK